MDSVKKSVSSQAVYRHWQGDCDKIVAGRVQGRGDSEKTGDFTSDIPAELKLRLDVTSNESVAAAVAEAVRNFGRI